MQLKNVGVIVVILVPRHDTRTVQRGRGGGEGRIGFLLSLVPFWRTHSNTRTRRHTHTHTRIHAHLCGSFLIVPLMRLKKKPLCCAGSVDDDVVSVFSFSILYNLRVLVFVFTFFLFFFLLSLCLDWRLIDLLTERLTFVTWEGKCTCIFPVHCNNNATTTW